MKQTAGPMTIVVIVLQLAQRIRGSTIICYTNSYYIT